MLRERRGAFGIDGTIAQLNGLLDEQQEIAGVYVNTLEEKALAEPG